MTPPPFAAGTAPLPLLPGTTTTVPLPVPEDPVPDDPVPELTLPVDPLPEPTGATTEPDDPVPDEPDPLPVPAPPRPWVGQGQ